MRKLGRWWSRAKKRHSFGRHAQTIGVRIRRLTVTEAPVKSLPPPLARSGRTHTRLALSLDEWSVKRADGCGITIVIGQNAISTSLHCESPTFCFTAPLRHEVEISSVPSFPICFGARACLINPWLWTPRETFIIEVRCLRPNSERSFEIVKKVSEMWG